MTAEAIRKKLRERWPDEFNDGARCAFIRRADGKREAGGDPAGFHAWAPERRNAWFSGFNVGRVYRERDESKDAA